MRPSDKADTAGRAPVTLVDVEDVSVIHQGQVMLSDVSLHMTAGERVALVGTPGPGRTSLLATVGTLTQPTSGTMRLVGVDVTELRPGQLADLRAQQLGLVLRGAGLVPFLTVGENLALTASLRRSRQSARVQGRHLSRISEELGLVAQMDNRPAQLSAADRRLAEIGRALVQDPALLLVDEPTAGLAGPEAARVTEALFRAVGRRGSALLVATDDPAVSGRADRVVRLDGGRLAPVGGQAGSS